MSGPGTTHPGDSGSLLAAGSETGGFRCSVCGMLVPIGAYHACGGSPTYPIPTPAPFGWQCPVCGRVYAPSVQACWYDHGDSALGGNAG